MFLNKLDFVEKEAFISLAVLAAKANGEFAEEEYLMIEEYCKEVGIAFFDAENVKTIDEVIRVFAASEERHKKIAVLEIIGLMYADGGYDDKEREFVKEFTAGISVSDEAVVKMESALVKYMDMSKELLACIEEV